MRILVVGHRRETRALVRILRAADRLATDHFMDGTAALAALDQMNNQFDYVLLEGGEQTADHKDVVRAVRRRDSRVPIAYFSPPTVRAAAPRLVGAFEKSPRGVRILNCVLTGSGAESEGNCAYDLGDIVFEYQRPSRKGRSE